MLEDGPVLLKHCYCVLEQTEVGQSSASNSTKLLPFALGKGKQLVIG